MKLKNKLSEDTKVMLQVGALFLSLPAITGALFIVFKLTT